MSGFIEVNQTIASYNYETNHLPIIVPERDPTDRDSRRGITIPVGPNSRLYFIEPNAALQGEGGDGNGDGFHFGQEDGDYVNYFQFGEGYQPFSISDNGGAPDVHTAQGALGRFIAYDHTYFLDGDNRTFKGMGNANANNITARYYHLWEGIRVFNTYQAGNDNYYSYSWDGWRN